MSRARLTQLVAEISTHPSLGPLASRALTLAQTAWQTGDVVYPRPGSATWEGTAHLQGSGVQVGGGDLEHAAPDGIELEGLLARGATSGEDLDALTVLTLLGAASSWPSHHEARTQMATNLLWLEAHTGLHCLTVAGSILDATQQRQLAGALLAAIEAGTPLENPSNGSLRQVGLAWLSHGLAPHLADLAARATQIRLSTEGTVKVSPRSGDATLVGVLGPRPRPAWVLVAFAVTGILFLLRLSSLLARLVLVRRIPTSIWLSERGLELFARYELLGKVVKERRLVVPIEEIRTVEREVRFPRFGLYAGLVALSIGTILGTRMFIDGLRVSGLSLPLIGMGVLLILVGIALDLVLSAPGIAKTGQCRLVVTPYRGRGWAIGGLDTANVDHLLDGLSARLAARRA